MARVLHPKLYPAWGIYDYERFYGVETAMEWFWRVRRWYVDIVASYPPEHAGDPGPFYTQTTLSCGETSEEQIVCAGLDRTWVQSNFPERGIVLIIRYSSDSKLEIIGNFWGSSPDPEEGILLGYGDASEAQIFNGVINFGQGTATPNSQIPVTLDAYNDTSINVSGSVYPIEWWEYRDALGENPLYDKNTGQRI